MKPGDARPVSGRGEATTQAASRARDSGPQQQCTKRRAPAEAPSPGAGGTGTRRQVSRISRRGVRAPVKSLSARPSPLAPQRRPRRRHGPPFPLPLPSGNRVGAGDEHKGCGGAGGRSAPAAIRPSRSGGLVVEAEATTQLSSLPRRRGRRMHGGAPTPVAARLGDGLRCCYGGGDGYDRDGQRNPRWRVRQTLLTGEPRIFLTVTSARSGSSSAAPAGAPAASSHGARPGDPAQSKAFIKPPAR